MRRSNGPADPSGLPPPQPQPRRKSIINKSLVRRATTAVILVGTLALAACASTARTEGTGEYVDDTVVTTKVKTAVLNDPMLKSAEINVETFKGRVQLSGFVNSQADINQAVKVARGVEGVTSVTNDMKLK